MSIIFYSLKRKKWRKNYHLTIFFHLKARQFFEKSVSAKIHCQANQSLYAYCTLKEIFFCGLINSVLFELFPTTICIFFTILILQIDFDKIEKKCLFIVQIHC